MLSFSFNMNQFVFSSSIVIARIFISAVSQNNERSVVRRKAWSPTWHSIPRSSLFLSRSPTNQHTCQRCPTRGTRSVARVTSDRPSLRSVDSLIQQQITFRAIDRIDRTAHRRTYRTIRIGGHWFRKETGRTWWRIGLTALDRRLQQQPMAVMGRFNIITRILILCIINELYRGDCLSSGICAWSSVGYYFRDGNCRFKTLSQAFIFDIYVVNLDIGWTWFSAVAGCGWTKTRAMCSSWIWWMRGKKWLQHLLIKIQTHLCIFFSYCTVFYMNFVWDDA